MFQAFGFIVKYGAMVVRFGPVIVGVVRAVEQIRGGSLPGAQKKQIAMEVLEKSLQVFGYTLTPTVSNLIDNAIDTVVAAMTLRGEIKGGAAKVVVKEPVLKKETVAVATQILKNKQKLEDLKMLMPK